MENQNNFLVPAHRKLTSEEVKNILEKHQISDVLKLPKIKVKDPALSTLDASLGDVIEITRKSFAGETKYYRVVVE